MVSGGADVPVATRARTAVPSAPVVMRVGVSLRRYAWPLSSAVAGFGCTVLRLPAVSVTCVGWVRTDRSAPATGCPQSSARLRRTR